MAAARRRSRKKEPFEIDLTRLDEASDTELVLIARHIGYPNASRQMVREDLIDMILGEEFDVDDPLEEIRRRTYAFVTARRRSLDPQAMKCDFYCPGCPHNKVIECYTDNHGYVDAHAESELIKKQQRREG